jgi:hypothetical protein
MTVSDDRAQLRARFPAPADRDLPPGRHLLHRENLMSQILNEPPSSQPGNSEPPRGRRPAPRRSPAWHPSARGLLATAAAVALVAGLGVTASDRLWAHPGTLSRPTAASPGATATAVLDRIAQAAAARPPVKVGPNQYFYVKAKVVNSTPVPPWMPSSGVAEGWIAQSQSKETLWNVGGHSEILKNATQTTGTTTFPGFGGPVIGVNITAMTGNTLLYPTYAYLQSLPTNPRQLLSLLERQASRTHLGVYVVFGSFPINLLEPNASDTDFEAFAVIGQLLSTEVLPPQTAAALYRAAALIPGVTVVPDATDALGRHGIGIALGAGRHLREEWVFSKSTYQFLGARTTIPLSTDSPTGKTTYTHVSAILARGIANILGGTPTLTK